MREVVCFREVKFYLDAAAEKRAQRRLEEMRETGQASSYEAVLEDIRARDNQDMSRKDSPLVKTADACYVDTTELREDDVVARLHALVRDRIPAK